jgi:hypothetical protein
MISDLFKEGCARADDWARFLLSHPESALAWCAAEYRRDKERRDLERTRLIEKLFEFRAGGNGPASSGIVKDQVP